MSFPGDDTLSDEEIALLLSQGQQAAVSYGSGPGFLSAEDNPYARIGQRADTVSDIFRTAGIYPEDLLGLPDAPQAPQMPEFYMSDTAPLYANNELIQTAYELVSSGQLDPIQATARVRQLVQDDPSLRQFVPQGTRQGMGGAQETYDDWNSFQSTLETLGKDANRSNREQAQYRAQVDRYNDYFEPTTEWELMGSPELDQFVQSRFGNRRPETLRVQAPDWMANPSNPRGTDNAAEMRGQIRAGVNPDRAVQDYRARQGRAGVGGRPWSEGQMGQATLNKPLQVAKTLNALEEAAALRRLDEAKQNRQPSKAEQANRARLSNAYQLLFGEPAPTRDENRRVPVKKDVVSSYGRR